MGRLWVNRGKYVCHEAVGDSLREREWQEVWLICSLDDEVWSHCLGK